MDKIYTSVRVFGSILADSISINDKFVFPNEDGESGQILSTDGGGNLSWLNLESIILSTDNISEGSTNLYFTEDRVDDRVRTFIKNGPGLKWTYDNSIKSLTGEVTLSPFSTTNLSEGVNLYYTVERVDDRVSSLIKNGTGINWSYNDSTNSLTPTVTLSPFSTTNLSEGVNLYYTTERAQDAAASLIRNGTGISWLYNDIANSLTPTVTLSPFSTDNLSEGSTNLYFTGERVDDRVATLIQDSETVTWSYSDNGIGAGTLQATANASLSIQDAGNLVGSRNIINFIEGSGISLDISNDSINSRLNVEISSTGELNIDVLNTILSSGLQVGDSDILALNFLNKFSITESPNQQVNIDINMLIDELSDVVLTSPISDGDALVYDSGSGMWINSQVGDQNRPVILVNAMHYFSEGMNDYSVDTEVQVHGSSDNGWWSTFALNTTTGVLLTPGSPPISLLSNMFHSSLITVPESIQIGSTIYLTYTIFAPISEGSRDQLVWYLGKIPVSGLAETSYIVSPLMPSESGFVTFGSELIENNSGLYTYQQETISFDSSSLITSGSDTLVIGFASKNGEDLVQSPVHLSYKLWY